MKQLVNYQDCAHCIATRKNRFYGCCCCFKLQRRNAAPLLISEEKDKLLKAFNLKEKYFLPVTAQGWQIQLQQRKDGLYCPFLNRKRWRCTIYPSRPFECRIFPAAFTKKGSELWLGLNQECIGLKMQAKQTRVCLQQIQRQSLKFLMIFSKQIKQDPLVEPLLLLRDWNGSC